MVLGRFIRGAETQQVAIGKERESTAQEVPCDLLIDHPVGHQHINPILTIEEDVQIILAIGRIHDALQHHLTRIARKNFRFFLGLQVITIRENQPLITGQHHACLPHRIHLVNGLKFFIENKITRLVFPEGNDLKQNHRALDGVINLGILHLLVAIGNLLGINALPGIGGVLHLDRQVTPHAFHKHSVLNGNMRVKAMPRGRARWPAPLKVKLLGKRLVEILGFGAAVHVGQPAIGQHPFVHHQVIQQFPFSKHHVQVRSNNGKLVKGRLGTFLEHQGEGLHKILISQKRDVRLKEFTLRFIVIKCGKHITQLTLLEAQVHVEAEKKPVLAEFHHVARLAVELRGHIGLPLASFLELKRARTKHRLTLLAQNTQRLPQHLGLLGQALLDEIVRATLQRIGRAFRGGSTVGRFRHKSLARLVSQAGRLIISQPCRPIGR